MPWARSTPDSARDRQKGRKKMLRCLGTGALSIWLLAAVQTTAPLGVRLLVTVKNGLSLKRPSETVVLSSQDILGSLQAEDLRRIRVSDTPSGAELIPQAIDLDGDSVPDQFVFQADFGPGQSRTFGLAVASVRIPKREEFRVYGRFVRERFDDFAWENDRIAHRMYGTALETWVREPLTSSAVDVWCKRVRRLIVNDWYMVDNYHEDTGEGADFYSAGRSRGCGGSGIWEEGRLHVSRNFIGSRVLANGPIRLVFELIYAPWQAGGREVSEVKRITLDAGQNLNRFESYYKSSGTSPLTFAVGIKKGEGSTALSDSKQGWLRTWEPLRKGQAGNLGCGIVIDPSAIVATAEGDGNYLVIARCDGRLAGTYYAGFGWDRSGDFDAAAAWTDYLKQAAMKLRSPLKVAVAPPSAASGR